MTGTATGNGARWYEVTASLHAADPVGRRSLCGEPCLVEQARPAVRDFLQAYMNEVEEAQWKLGPNH